MPVGVDLLDIDGLYLMYFTDDVAYAEMRKDPRARSINPDDAAPRWKHQPPVDINDVWNNPDRDLFTLVFTHCWRQGVEFSYFDIGAHCGITSIPHAIFFKRCAKKGNLYAFEPGPVFELLEQSIRLNQVDDITSCMNLAVADRSGEIRFNVLDRHSPGSSLLDDAITRVGGGNRNVPTHCIVVDSVSIDDFVGKHRITSNLVCKIDTEGADFKVLDGMAKCLQDRLVTMQLEFIPQLVDSYTDPVERLRALSGDFLLMERVGKNACQRIGAERADIVAFVESVRSSPSGYTDIFAIPKSMPNLQELSERIIRA